MKPQAFDLMRNLQDTYWWYRARKEIICDTVTRFVRPGSELLDFGAGSGGIAKKLSAEGYKVVAADVSLDALAACREAGLDTLDLNTTWLAADSIDCILASDVLEHVKDDIELLHKLRMALRGGGWLVATVPAYDFLWSGEDYISDHVRRYTQYILEERVRQAGFTIKWSTYINAFLLPLIVGVLLYKRLLKPREMYMSDIQPLPQWQNDLLYKIFAAERFILRHWRFPVGASFLVVAQSPYHRPQEPSPE
jgi:2-polyprenyl-3-methyl-5-hydroxy-6-metoxy-1,4-benzoquinol methylase